jgi:hypothetical protein
MATTAAPYGLRPINLIGGQSFTGGTIRKYVMTVNSATGIFFGDLVKLSDGEPSPVTATPTTSTRGIVGVCVGVSYTDPTLKYTQFSQYLPANAVSSGYTNILISVIDDPDQLYQVQADNSVTRAKIGNNAELGNFSAGSTTSGNSKITLEAGTIANTATFAVRIVDLVDGAPTFSTPGDAFTDCIVKLNFGVHSYQQSTGSGTT